MVEVALWVAGALGLGTVSMGVAAMTGGSWWLGILLFVAGVAIFELAFRIWAQERRTRAR